MAGDDLIRCEISPHLMARAVEVGYTPDQVVAIFTDHAAANAEWVATGVVAFSVAVVATAVIMQIVAWVANQRIYNSMVVETGAAITFLCAVGEFCAIYLWVRAQIAISCPEYYVLIGLAGG